MNTQPPLLPETKFKPLSEARLERMIDVALSHQQLPAQAQVINFRNWRQNLTFGGTMAAMAASIMLAFMMAPPYTPTATSGTLGNSAVAADVSDLLLLDSLES